MPSINPLKNAEVLAKTVKSVKSAQPTKEILSSRDGVMPSAETLRGYAGVIIKKMYADGTSVAKSLGFKDIADFEHGLKMIEGSGVKPATFDSVMALNRITDKELGAYIEEKCFGGTVTEAVKDGLYTSKEEFLRDFVEDLQAYPFIKNHPVFEPYNLNIAETSAVLDVLKSGVTSVIKKGTGVIDFASIERILKEKNPKLYESLGASEMFSEQTIIVGSGKKKTIIPSRESLIKLQDNLCGKDAVRKVIEDSEHVKTMDCKINGETKSFLYKDSLAVSSDIPQINDDAIVELIHSNMLTLDLIKSPEFKKLLESNPKAKKIIEEKTLTIKNPELLVHGNKKTDVTFYDLAQKLEKEGINSLNSYEIHALTDALEDAYKAITDRRKNILVEIKKASTPELEQGLRDTNTENLIKSLEPKSKKIYGIIQGMKETVKARIGGNIDRDTKQYSKDGKYFADHFFMRMIDRDVANVTENETGKILSVDEIVSRIIKTDLGKKDKLPDLQGNGLKVISTLENGKLTVSTLMQ